MAAARSAHDQPCSAIVTNRTSVLPGDDLNLAENAIRSIALGRKNYLFAGSDTGGERAAAIYTIVQTAKLNGLNQEAYLRDILASIAEGHPINRVNELLPWPRDWGAKA